MKTKRLLSFLVATCMTVGMLPVKETAELWQNQISVEAAYTSIADYPDFNLNMYVADLMSNSKKDAISYRMLSYYLEEAKSPNTIIFELLDDDAVFTKAVAAWETENAITKPAESVTNLLNEEGYYEAIIMNVLNDAFTSDAFCSTYTKQASELSSNIYSLMTNSVEMVYYIKSFNDIKFFNSALEINNFKKAMNTCIDMELYLNESPINSELIKTWNDALDIVDVLLPLCNSMVEFVEKFTTYYYCNQMSKEMKQLMHTLHNNCDASNVAMKSALYNIALACDNYALAMVEAFADSASKGMAQAAAVYVDKMWQGVIAASPVGFGLLLEEALVKSAVNFIFSTDKICEQYFKMKRFYKFEMLVRSTAKKCMSGYQANPSNDNALLLFAANKVFFQTYDTSCEYANDYANLMFKENILGKYFGNTDTYNQLTTDIRKIRGHAAEVQSHLENLYFLADLEYEYPDIYEAYIKQTSTNPIKIVYAEGISFSKNEIEIGLEDSFAWMRATVQPSNATNQQISYTSSAPEIATCTDNGTINPHTVGTTVITATAADGGFTAELVVNVVEGHGEDGFYIEPTQIKPAKVGDSFDIGELRYFITSENTVSVGGISASGSVYIPKAVGYNGTLYEVTEIRSRGFWSDKSLISLTIPDSVTTIGESAFGYCHSLISVTIPDSVTSIGKNAFGNCHSLISVNIPDGITTIKYDTFYSCESLISLTIPNSVTSIEGCAFKDCYSLTSITIPNSVTSIGGAAFAYCKSLTSITIPDSITSIENNLFEECSNLTSITIPDRVTSIGSHAFYECSSLISITIPDSVTTIGDRAFEYCHSLTSITIPDKVTRIGNDAFYNCSDLTEITILNSDCYIYDYRSTISNGKDENHYAIYNGVIRGYENSTAQSYAKRYGYKFESLGEAPDDVILYGDCNDDGEFTVADVVLLQKWLLTVPNIRLVNWKAADLFEDGRLDVFDLVMMKRLLLKS